jgi:hypothetical protein
VETIVYMGLKGMMSFKVEKGTTRCLEEVAVTPIFSILVIVLAFQGLASIVLRLDVSVKRVLIR